MSKVNNFSLVIYTDVWGNSEDGWQVNDMTTAFSDLRIIDEATNQDVLTYLKTSGWLTTDDPAVIEIEWMDDSIAEINEKETGFPLGRLVKTEPEAETVAYTCFGCKYFPTCGDPERTEECEGKETKDGR